MNYYNICSLPLKSLHGWKYRMWDMSDCICMASGDRRFSGNFFALYFISITFERNFKVFKVFSDMSLVKRRLF